MALLACKWDPSYYDFLGMIIGELVSAVDTVARGDSPVTSIFSRTREVPTPQPPHS